jgi:hypothetical protein
MADLTTPSICEKFYTRVVDSVPARRSWTWVSAVIATCNLAGILLFGVDSQMHSRARVIFAGYFAYCTCGLLVGGASFDMDQFPRFYTCFVCMVVNMLCVAFAEQQL